LLCTRFFRVVERLGDELCEIRLARHVARFADLLIADLTVGDGEIVGAFATLDDVVTLDAQTSRVFDGVFDSRIVAARLQRLRHGETLRHVQIVIAVAIDAELERAAALGSGNRDLHCGSSSAVGVVSLYCVDATTRR
jgi:hypothetical protein